MNGTLRAALISMATYTSDGVPLLKEVMNKLRETLGVEGVSSIYKVKGEAIRVSHVHDLRTVREFEGLCAVVEVQTELSPEKLLGLLQKIETDLKREQLNRSVSLNLLLYEDQTYMTSELTLPHPDFHLRPELLIPAAEIWGEAAHPVLNLSLAQLARTHQGREWGEFFAQGQSLLDF